MFPPLSCPLGTFSSEFAVRFRSLRTLGRCSCLLSGSAATHQLPVTQVPPDPSGGVDIQSQEVLHPLTLLRSVDELIQTDVTCGVKS